MSNLKSKKTSAKKDSGTGLNARILVLHGPNLNLLGTREPDVYGRTTLADIHAMMEARAHRDGVQIESFQSNSEGGLIDRVQAAGAEGNLFARWAGYHAKFVGAQQELGATTQAFLAKLDENLQKAMAAK